MTGPPPDVEVIEVHGVQSPVEVIETASRGTLDGAQVISVGDRPPVGGSGHYTHIQVVGQSVVTITHNLGFRPAGVSLFSLDYGIKYRAYGVQHLNENTLRVSMDQPTPFVCEMS